MVTVGVNNSSPEAGSQQCWWA